MSQDPFVPKGVTQRKGKGQFNNKFASTVMGTAMFVAEMQRKVPLRTKLLVTLFVLVGGGLGAWAYLDMTSRAASAAELTLAVAEPYETGAPHVRSMLEKGLHSGSRAAAYRYLGEAQDAASVSLLVTGLRASPEERKAAAEALSRIGAPAALPGRDALAELLPSTDPTEALLGAWVLVALGDPRGLEPAIAGLASGALQQVPTYDAAKLAALLGPAGLVTRLRDTHPSVRQFAATWLGPVCDESATTALTEAARDAVQEVVVAACVSLGRCGTPQALDAVAAALASKPALREPLGQAFSHEVGAPGLALLLQTTEERSTRALLMRFIAELYDPRAGDALLRELGRTTELGERLAVASALAEIGDARVVGAVAPLLEQSDGDWARQGVEALGRSGNAEAVGPVLLGLLQSRRDLAGVILTAMGEAGVCSDEALRAMRAGAGAASTEPWALGAMARCGDPEAGTLALRILARPGARDGNVLFAAFDAAARLGLTAASEKLVAQLGDPATDPRLRLAAADALGIVGDDATLERLADRLVDPATTAPQRTALARALSHRLPAGVLGRLMGYLRSGGDDDRTLAVVSVLGAAADATLQDELTTLLDDTRARNDAAFAVALGGNSAGLARLVRLMRTERALDEVVRARMTSFHPLFDRRDLESGRIYDRMERLLALRDLGIGAFWDAYATSLKQGSQHPGAVSARELRRGLTRDLVGADERKRRLAAEALLASGARGVLLAVRAGRGVGAAEATSVLER
jgi:HEAT repeat protein